jgi:hydrogenase-4 component E
MTDSYAGVLDLAPGGLVLTAVLIVWRRDLHSIVRLLALQGVALAAIPVILGAHIRDWELVGVGVALFVLRGVVLPWLLAHALGGEERQQREATPLVNSTASLLIAAGLVVVALAVTRPVVDLDAGAAVSAVPAGFAVVLIAMFVMVTRRHAISQAAGFLMLDNGIAATAFLLTAGVPLIVELGASLDVLFALIVLGVLTGRLRRMLGGADLDRLQSLRD